MTTRHGPGRAHVTDFPPFDTPYGGPSVIPSKYRLSDLGTAPALVADLCPLCKESAVVIRTHETNPDLLITGSEQVTVINPDLTGSADADEAAQMLVVRRLEPNDETIVLSVAGDIDLASGQMLRTKIRSCFDSRMKNLVIDLSGVEFIGSTGLSVLVDAQAQADREGASLRLVTSARCVDRALHICGLDQQFACHPDLDSALAH